MNSAGIGKLKDTKIDLHLDTSIQPITQPHTNVPEPLNMSKMPNNAFEEVSIDFCGPFPDGKYLMVVIDEYSRFLIVEILNTVSARTVIPALDKIFSEYGIPNVLKSDNGPPFNGSDFQKFSQYMGFKHRKITPVWPAANAEF
jgi:transposase InsO family protein